MDDLPGRARSHDGAADLQADPRLLGTPVSRLSHTRPAARTGQRAGRQIVTLSCFRFDRFRDRAVQLSSMAGRKWLFSRIPGLGFARMMGTGTGEGFDPAPNTAVWTILATWDDETAAAKGLASAPWARRRARASEHCTLTMAPLSSSGRWGGTGPFEAWGASAPEECPMAVLTRATVRASHAREFWSKVPAINRQIAAGPGMLFRLGMGEVPLLHQVTFSVWSDPQAMRRFAYGGEGHRAAIAAVRRGDWFAEELYARFAVISAEGTWNGRPPLSLVDRPL
ncbi:MAG: spheroidene monooxygenase [Pseudomonadota bacterium]